MPAKKNCRLFKGLRELVIEGEFYHQLSMT